MDQKKLGGEASTPGRGDGGGGASSRQSSIPKPSSRLPLPKSSIPKPPTPSRALRQTPTPSSENLRASQSTTGTLRNPRLRPAAAPSREQPSFKHYYPAFVNPAEGDFRPSSAAIFSRDVTENRLIPADSPYYQKPLGPTRPPSHNVGRGTQLPTTSTMQHQLDKESSPLDDASAPPDGSWLQETLAVEALEAEIQSLYYKPAPSLNERTIQTLSNVPPSPAVKRRGSNFFDTSSVRKSQSKGSLVSRPDSSYQTNRPNEPRSLSRPTSSSGPRETDVGNFRASTNTYKPPLPAVRGTPTKQASGFGAATTTPDKNVSKANPRASISRVPSLPSMDTGPIDPRSPSPIPKWRWNTVAARPRDMRGSANNAFVTEQPMPPVRKAASRSTRKAADTPTTSEKGRNASGLSTASTAIEGNLSVTSRKSSAALRDQIAQAKAAKRAAARQVSSTAKPETEASIVPIDNDFDFGLSDDPFGQKKFEDSNRKALKSRLVTARTTGRLNIAAMGLNELPDEVLNMYEFDPIVGNASWAESVDLTRLVAADNNLQTIDDSIFPDIGPNDDGFDEMEDRGRMFWGLESADLHNNMLISLPWGLRRLEQLTSLNLASNKLTNDSLEIVAQCRSLRDLKLGNNLLYGSIGDFFVLENLETLDIHGNHVSALPNNLEKMKRLKIVNVDENDFETLPFKSLAALPLSELTVRKNKLSGTLIDGQVRSLPQLQILDCSANQLTYLFPPDATERLALSSLHQLTVSMNRLRALPDLNDWKSILTINADDNSITSFPDGFVTRESLRHAGFSSNDIRVIPPEIARMDNLVMLRITGNPLRDKKFTSLPMDALKDALLARLEPLPSQESSIESFANGISSVGAHTFSSTGHDAVPLEKTTLGISNREVDDDEQSEMDAFATPPTSPERTVARGRSQTLSSQTWPMKAGGVLDRSNTQSSSLHPVVCSKIAAVQSVREVRLQHNTFTQFPNSLSFFSDTITSLTLSHNQLTGESWLTERLDLTALKQLNLRSNYCTSLSPLTTNLCAPNLEKLDVSLNRIVRIPALRDFFPSLVVLLVANNRLEELDPETIHGMKIVDAGNNEIAHLNPRIGLLGLERLDVMGNRFRVPKWSVLERGTESTLRWLRARVPVAEMADWRAKNGVAEDDPEGVD